MWSVSSAVLKTMKWAEPVLLLLRPGEPDWGMYSRKRVVPHTQPIASEHTTFLCLYDSGRKGGLAIQLQESLSAAQMLGGVLC